MKVEGCDIMVKSMTRRQHIVGRLARVLLAVHKTCAFGRQGAIDIYYTPWGAPIDLQHLAVMLVGDFCENGGLHHYYPPFEIDKYNTLAKCRKVVNAAVPTRWHYNAQDDIVKVDTEFWSIK